MELTEPETSVGASESLRPHADAASPFFLVYCQCFVRPTDAMRAVWQSANPVRYGAYGVAIAAGVYLLVYFFLSRNGGRPTVFTPWLAIPPEVYYRYNLILHVPSVLLAWVAAAGFAQLAAKALGGKGSFEGLLGVLGLATGVAIWTTGLHDVVTAGLGYLGLIDQRSYEDAMSTPGTGPHLLIWTLMLLYVSVFGALYTKGVRVVHALGPWRARATAALGFVVYQGVYSLFNR